MKSNALLWLKTGDSFGEGANRLTLVYREMKNGHFYGLLWNDFIDIGSIVRLDDATYYITVFDKDNGIDFIKQHDEHDFEYYL